MEHSVNILILSDTHGNYPLAIKATDVVGPVDSIIHLGDGLDDARILEEITGLPMITVVGNCDFSTSVPNDIAITVAGLSIFITHGHKYGVKSSLSLLHQKAVERGTSVVLFGHTHVPYIEEINDVLFINPGCMGENSQVKSCALLSIISGKLSAKIVSLD